MNSFDKSQREIKTINKKKKKKIHVDAQQNALCLTWQNGDSGVLFTDDTV